MQPTLLAAVQPLPTLELFSIGSPSRIRPNPKENRRKSLNAQTKLEESSAGRQRRRDWRRYLFVRDSVDAESSDSGLARSWIVRGVGGADRSFEQIHRPSHEC